MGGVQPNWRGTEQHRDAIDLSRWLVHLTRSEADLISILKSGVIRGGLPYGIPRRVGATRDDQRSVCLTETPLDSIHRMTTSRPWGLVFDKERLRVKFGAQPVWYLSDPSPQLAAIERAISDAESQPTAPIWDLTPYIDQVRSLQGDFPKDWRWEREWRVRGDLRFAMSDVVLVLTNDAGAPAFLEDVSVGVPWYDHDSFTTQWVGGVTDAWDSEIDAMLARFDSTFIAVQETDLPWDSEEGGYAPIVEFVELAEAIDEVFGTLNDDLRDAIESALEVRGYEWCRHYDLDHVHE